MSGWEPQWTLGKLEAARQFFDLGRLGNQRIERRVQTHDAAHRVKAALRCIDWLRGAGRQNQNIGEREQEFIHCVSHFHRSDLIARRMVPRVELLYEKNIRFWPLCTCGIKLILIVRSPG
jgi:hypothetical protein